MKERHYGQQPICLRKTQPLTNLTRVGNHVAVRQQTTFWFAGGSRGVDDDGFVVGSHPNVIGQALHNLVLHQLRYQS